MESHVNFKGKIPSTGEKISAENRTHDAASSRTVSPTHYQRAIPAPTPLLMTEESDELALAVRASAVRMKDYPKTIK